MLLTEQERLMTYLEQAESIEEMMTIESRLSDIRYQLESMESQLRTYDSQIEYSTVSLYISEVVELTPVETKEQTTWERISEGFYEACAMWEEALRNSSSVLLLHCRIYW